MVSNFKKKLASMKDIYAKAKERKNAGFEINIENGKYRASLSNLELMESASSGKAMVKREWTVLEGDYDGTVFSDFLHIENEVGMSILQGFIEQCGYQIPDNPEGLEEVLNAILKDTPECMIQVRIKDDFINVRVKEILSGSEAAPEGETEEVEEVEEVVGDELDEMDRNALKKVIKDEQIDIKIFKTTTDDELRAAIRAQRPVPETEGEEEEVEEEIAEVEKVEEVEEEEEEEVESKDSAKVTALKNFCDSNDIAYDKKTSDEKNLISLIKKTKLKASDLTEKEKKFLREIGVSVK